MDNANPQLIRNMFSKVALKYDLANSILSIGIHHLWRKKLVRLSQAAEGQRVLDCATGTGDLAIAFKKAVGDHGHVIGTDFCEAMLIQAPQKAKQENLKIEFELADVTQLQFENRSFDLTSISFGIRNVNQPLLGLREMARVTKSGGKVMILEFGQIQNKWIAPLYSFYSQKILPFLGGLVTGQKDAYKYLQTSSAAFPSDSKFAEMMMSTGSFTEIKIFPLHLGIAYIYIGIVK